MLFRAAGVQADLERQSPGMDAFDVEDGLALLHSVLFCLKVELIQL